MTINRKQHAAQLVRKLVAVSATGAALGVTIVWFVNSSLNIPTLNLVDNFRGTIFGGVLGLVAGLTVAWTSTGSLSQAMFKARHLDLSQYFELTYLWSRRIVRAKGVGQDITRIHATLSNCLTEDILVSITPGTYFVAKGNFQNMATTRKHELELGPLEERTVYFDAVCINAGLPIPTESNSFRGVKLTPDSVAKYIERASGESAMVIQAGVWALTDGLSGIDIRNRLISTDQTGKRTSAITEEDISAAKTILEDLGLGHNLY